MTSTPTDHPAPAPRPDPDLPKAPPWPRLTLADLKRMETAIPRLWRWEGGCCGIELALLRELRDRLEFIGLVEVKEGSA